MKGPNLHREVVAHTNKSPKLISMENALEENPRKSFRITATPVSWGMSTCM